MSTYSYTVLNDLVVAIQRRALSDLREENSYLGAFLNSSSTTFNLQAGQTLGSIQSGSLIQIDWEMMFVMDASDDVGPIQVVRGWFDSAAASHQAGAIVNVNPRFPVVDIVQAINEDIDDLSAPTNGLFQMLEVTLSFIPVVQGYDLTGLVNSDVMEIWEVRGWEYGPSNKYPILPPQAWQIQRNADPNLFPSGMSLTVSPGMGDAGLYAGRPIRVQYKAPYTTPLVNPTDNITTVTGLHQQAHDIPVLGAPARLMQSRELKRSFSEAQGEPRRAQEVAVGSSLTASKGLLMYRQQRIDAERSRLQLMYRKQMR